MYVAPSQWVLVKEETDSVHCPQVQRKMKWKRVLSLGTTTA
jgi:hypothetical protein